MLALFLGLAPFVSALAAEGDPEIARLTPSESKIMVNGGCDKGRVFMRIQNVGDKWPSRGQLVVFDRNTNEEIVGRGLRLASNQTATFRLPTSFTHGNLGVRVHGAWMDKPFSFDAAADCRGG